MTVTGSSNLNPVHFIETCVESISFTNTSSVNDNPRMIETVLKISYWCG